MIGRITCLKHYGKVIFYTLEKADIHIRTHFTGRNFESYPCPAGEGHFHIRNRTKRNTMKRRNKKRNRRQE